MKKKYIYIIFLILSIFFVLDIFAAPWDPPSGDPPLGPAAPIDGGLGFLLAAGIAYGAKKLHNAKKHK